MAKIQVFPSKLSGKISIPPSKSQTLRAILFAALANGESRIENYLLSPDTDAMLKAVELFGAKIKRTKESLFITGFDGKPSTPDDVINAGNSGIVLRFITALAALNEGFTIITGDHSIRHSRPMHPLLSALSQLGASALSSKNDGFAPIVVGGSITGNQANLDGQDSQPISALLIALSFAKHPIQLKVENPGEIPWIDMTLDWLKRLGIRMEQEKYQFYQTFGGAKINEFYYVVPADFSSAAFPLAAALLTGSSVVLEGLNLNDCQGDKEIFPILEQMGAHFTIGEKTVTVHESGPLNGASIDINRCIDTLPILAVIATQAKTPTTIYNGSIARTKETDRIFAIAKELKKMGANIEEKTDGLLIQPSKLKGAHLTSYFDHRISMSLTVAALSASSPSVIEGVECMAKTYANFVTDLKNAGAKIE